MPEDARARLWADPDVRVWATALESLRPPLEVLLRLVHDPAIQRQHFRSQTALGYMAGSPIFRGQPEVEHEFRKVLMNSFGLGIDWYVH